MKSGTGLSLMVVATFLSTATATFGADLPASRRIELRVETLANLERGFVQPCEVIQVKSADSSPLFASWSALAEVGASEGASKNVVRSVPRTAVRCGPGVFFDTPSTVSGAVAAPFLIQQVSANVGWDAGTMDPGPVEAIQVFLTLTARQRTGFSPEGRPIYGAPSRDQRSIRLEPGEEYLVPLPQDSSSREALGVHEVLLRIRAGWAGRMGATEYGALAVTNAAPGSEVLVDGGVAGRVGADGSFRSSTIPVGPREVRVRAPSGAVASRFVSVVNGRTVLVTLATQDSGSPREPSLTAAGKNSEGFPEFRRKRDGATMVQIPEGEFRMGNLETEGAPFPHDVFVSTFLMDKLPVTVGRFKCFADATGRPLPPDPYWGVHDDFPVAFVRWDEAKAYCEWVGGRLPTEAEREKATRGTDGRMWPWGSEPPTPERGVFRGVWGEDGNDAVGARPAGASAYGLLDTGGNMWEFCEDWWDPNYFKSSPNKDPAGPKTGRARVVKGGSWDSRPTVLSASSRNFAYIGYREGDFGFRCAADPPAANPADPASSP